MIISLINIFLTITVILLPSKLYCQLGGLRCFIYKNSHIQFFSGSKITDNRKYTTIGNCYSTKILYIILQYKNYDIYDF